jgi:hypothetical protein
MATTELAQEVEAGREMNVAIAERVMGEPMPPPPPDDTLDRLLSGSPVVSEGGNWIAVCVFEEGDVPRWEPRPFSEDISAAWEVVEQLRSRFGYRVQIGQTGDRYQVSVTLPPPTKVLANVFEESAAFAICKAALKAVEGK